MAPNPSNGKFILLLNTTRSQLDTVRIQNLQRQQLYAAMQNITGGTNKVNMNLYLPERLLPRYY
jgi:hypothetical protein